MSYGHGSSSRHSVGSSRRRNHNSDDDTLDGPNDMMRAAAAVALYGYMEFTLKKRIPLHNSPETGEMRVQALLNPEANPEAIYNKIRMNRDTFRLLSDFFRERQLLMPTKKLNVDEQLFIFLHIIAHGPTIREAADQCQHSIETIQRWFSFVLDVVCSVQDEFIRPPDYNIVQPFIVENGTKYRPWFDHCVGAIDGTHVPYVPPTRNAEAWRNRKGQYSQNLLGACSFDMRFTYILTGWEGSAHDARVLADALTRKAFPVPPIGKFYVADSGYALTHSFITSYRGDTYHLPEYRKRRRGLRTPMEVFNYTHSSLRNCIERTFGIWKKRFGILRKMNCFEIEKQVKIPVACAIIHNFIVMVRQNDKYVERYDHDGVPVSELRRNDTDDDGDEDDDEVDDQISIPNGPMVEEGASVHFRDFLTQLMWTRFQEQPWYRV